MSTTLDGQVAVVSGAGRGLGRAYAIALAAAGARVVVNDVDAEPCQEVIDTIIAAGGQAIADAGTIADSSGAERAVGVALDHFGGIDIMVTNAGADRRGGALDLTTADFEFTFGVHVYGTIHCSTAAARAMRDQNRGGCIINVTSPAFYQGTPTLTPYCASKGAIYGFMRTLSQELAPLSIAVNAVAPPLTTTGPVLAYLESLGSMGLPPEQVEAIKASAQDPADVAPMVVYLASTEGRRHSGHVFTLTRDAVTLVVPPAEHQAMLTATGGGPSLDALATAVATLTER